MRTQRFKVLSINRLLLTTLLLAMLFVTSTATAQQAIKIKGIATDSVFKAGEILVIVDGVPCDSINKTDPADIETVTVLKDEASKLIYGPRAKNGVIMITTKTGSKKTDKNAEKIDPNTITVVGYETNKASADQEVLTQAEIMPKFNGSTNFAEFHKWVQTKLIYPQEARANGIQGRVIAQFVVNTEGKVVNVAILRGVNKELNDTVIKLIESSADWTPGEHKGKKVSVSFIIPVDFKLS